ncbi:MAG: prepilin-type N-terminal cleavage/methylation domain-containing protein [Verrucomicrobiota bacterium]
MDYQTKSLARPTRLLRKGFSFPELIIAMAIFGLVAGGVSATFIAFSQGLRLSMIHAEQAADARYAFEWINKKLHSISEPHIASSASFEFTTADLDGTAERIRIHYDSNDDELKSTEDGSTRVLLENVSSASFTYYDRFGAVTNTLIDINAAKLVINTEVATKAGANDVKTETSIITFRNRTF